MGRKAEYIADVEQFAADWVRSIARSVVQQRDRGREELLGAVELWGHLLGDSRAEHRHERRLWGRVLPEVRDEINKAGHAAALREVERVCAAREGRS